MNENAAAIRDWLTNLYADYALNIATLGDGSKFMGVVYDKNSNSIAEGMKAESVLKKA